MKEHNDPSNWKFGVFYFNKDDKRLFVPKRIRLMGITVNFAHPYSWLIIISTIILIAIIAKYNYL